MASTTKIDTETALPSSEAEIDALRQEIDRLDSEILAAIQRRTEVSQLIGRTRMASGGPRMVHSREMKVLDRFSSLGQEGHTLAMLLLRLGRGGLGRLRLPSCMPLRHARRSSQVRAVRSGRCTWFPDIRRSPRFRLHDRSRML